MSRSLAKVWLGSGLALAALLLVCAACAPAATPAPTAPPAGPTLPEKIVVAWSPPDIGIVWETAAKYMEKAAEEGRQHGFNIETIWESPPSHISFAEQAAIIEDLVERKVTGIIVSPMEPEAMRPSLERANQAGIPFVIVNLLAELEGLDVLTYVGFDNVETGRLACEGAVKWCKENKPNETCYLGIVEGLAGGFYSTMREEGCHQAIDPYPLIEVVGKVTGEWDKAKAVSVTEDLLTANPVNLDVIYAESDNMGLGATEAIKTAGRWGDIVVVTQNGTPESIEAVADGTLYADVWHGFPEWGWYGTEAIVMYACGLEDEIPLIQDVGPKMITTGNIDYYYPEPELRPIDWEYIKENCKPRQ